MAKFWNIRTQKTAISIALLYFGYGAIHSLVGLPAMTSILTLPFVSVVMGALALYGLLFINTKV